MKKATNSSAGRALTSLAAIPFYLGVCPLTEPRRALEFLKHVYRFRRAERVYHRDQQLIHTVEAEEVFPGIFRGAAELIGASGPSGSLSCYEVYFLASLVRWLAPLMVLEIGTFEGRTTLNMAINCPSESRVYTLDLPPDHPSTLHSLAYPDEGQARSLPVGGLFRGHPAAGKIRQLWGDSAAYDFGEFQQSVNLVLVDGDHSYDGVKSDSMQALKMITAEGIVLWHDYDGSWPGVANCLRELASTRGLCHIRETSFVATWPSPAARPSQMKPTGAMAEVSR